MGLYSVLKTLFGVSCRQELILGFGKDLKQANRSVAVMS
jgi:hypothetical protein